jgi:hypothetical protein
VCVVSCGSGEINFSWLLKVKNDRRVSLSNL